MSVETWLDTVDGTPNVCIFWGGSTTKTPPPSAVVVKGLSPPPFDRSQWDAVNNQWVDVTVAPPVEVGSRDIRNSLTKAERRVLRVSANEDVQDAYEDVLTMGGYQIPVNDPKLSDFLVLVRDVHPQQPWDGLAALIGAP